MPSSDRAKQLFKKEDFAYFTVFELLKEYWKLVEDYDDDEHSIFYQWVVNNKTG